MYARVVDPSALAASIASHGLLGALLVVVAWVAWSKDRELQNERLARIQDAQDYRELALKLQAQVIDAVNKVSGILEELKKVMTPPPGRGTLR